MSQEKTEKRSQITLVMLIIAMVIFGTIGIFRKYIPLSSGMLAFVRGILGAAFLFSYVLFRGRNAEEGAVGSLKKELLNIGPKMVFSLFIMGAGIGINWMLLFESYNYTTVSIATLCYYMEPTIVILCSPFIFGEKLTPGKLKCAGAAVFGMVLVSGVLEGGAGSGAGNAKGIIFGLAAALLYAIEVMLNKKASHVDPIILTMIELFGAGAVMFPYVLITEGFGQLGQIDLKVALLLLTVGIVHTGITYVIYFGSMKKLKAQTIALISYIDPVTALVLSAVILHEQMSILGMIGAVLILGSTLISETGNK